MKTEVSVKFLGGAVDVMINYTTNESVAVAAEKIGDAITEKKVIKFVDVEGIVTLIPGN